jgi:hypothetical protein
MGATFLLIFAFALLLIAGVVFFSKSPKIIDSVPYFSRFKVYFYYFLVKKKKNDEHVLNSFKALVSGSPLTPANFGYMAKSSQSQRPPALIQGCHSFTKLMIAIKNIYLYKYYFEEFYLQNLIINSSS